MLQFKKRLYTRSELELMQEIDNLKRRVEQIEMRFWELKSKSSHKEKDENAELGVVPEGM